ncbi:hypothetical protein MT391_19095 [Vibrio sp. 1-Bac 57]
MSKKIVFKNKKKWSALIKNARQNEMSLALFISLLDQVKQVKKVERERKKFGDYLKWEDANSKGSFYLSVPIYSKKDNKPTGMTRMIFDRKEVPIEFQYLLKHKLDL